MKVKAKQAVWEDLSESYGLEYLQAYSPSSYQNNSESQSCPLEPQPFIPSFRQYPRTSPTKKTEGVNKSKTIPNPSL